MTDVAFTAPHFQATGVGLEVLRAGGSAVDAMVAAAAAIAVLYPHMNSLGGDGFWLIQHPGDIPIAIDACGVAGRRATPEWYRQHGYAAIPERGGHAALTVAGTVSGWELARRLAAQRGQALMALPDLLAPAIRLAASGVQVTESMARALRKCRDCIGQPDFAALYAPDGKAAIAGDIVRNPALATLLERLAHAGLQDFYSGDVAHEIAAALHVHDSPLDRDDLAAYQAEEVAPLVVTTHRGSFFNHPPPTQGMASLLILALYDRLYREHWTPVQRVHHLVECTKQAFLARDAVVTDRWRLAAGWADCLRESAVARMSAAISAEHALPWPRRAHPGDTVWMGALDRHGTLVSFIQSTYWEFGSGFVMPALGLHWNNRGLSFSLEPGALNALRPGARPFHTLNPAFALLHDGARLAYGTMGGEGQPQTQAAIINRFMYEGLSLAEAIAAPRWLLGRTWGETSHDLKMEASLAALIGDELRALGHDLEMVPDNNEMMGHAGAIHVDVHGAAQSASDPRSDGAAWVAGQATA